MEPKRMVSLNGRAETGCCRPFLCEDESGHSYFVKRGNVTERQLVLEFFLNHLAKDFGLAVPRFELVRIPEFLTHHILEKKDRDDIEPGIGFGSLRVPFGEDLNFSHLRHISEETKIKIFCFDWWVANSDRRLCYSHANPNLIWDPVVQSCLVIDHDQCLDGEFNPRQFFREHSFREIRPHIETSIYREYRDQFEGAVENLKNYRQWLPEEWPASEKRFAEKLEKILLKPVRPADGLLPIGN